MTIYTQLHSIIDNTVARFLNLVLLAARALLYTFCPNNIHVYLGYNMLHTQ